ncbi:MAG: DUF3015 family protein [Bdellovibrionales bacterium]|nr:DUF3015 family protein [Bdellovibrionales bacterium]
MNVKAVVGLLALALCLGFTAHQASAEKKALIDQVDGAGYGTAGCGLGSIIFGAKPGKIQIVSATTNGIYGNQSFGITSGTSNCDIPHMGQQAAVFIEVNKEALRKEAAIGQGESVDAVAMILNCEKAEVRSEMKSHFDRYFSEDVDSYETVRRLLNSGVCPNQG